MKRFHVHAAIAIAAAMTAVMAAQQLPPTVFAPIGNATKVAENLYVIPWQGGNTAVFVTATGVVLVDTKMPGNGQAILDKIRAVTSKPVTTIVNTHTHNDHVSSNEFFPAGVEIVAHENTAANMKRMDEFKGKPNALPDRTYKDRLTLGSGADRIDLYYFGAGHTNGDTFVVFPSARAMHTGDIFAWQAPSYVDPSNGGSVIAMPETLRKAATTIKNVDTIITGHIGTPVKWADFEEYVDFNREFVQAVRAARQAGRTADQAVAELKLPAKYDAYFSRAYQGITGMRSPRDLAATNVRIAYQEFGY